MSLAQRPNPARELTVAATNRLDDLPDCVDHKLRLLLVYFVAAVRRPKYANLSEINVDSQGTAYRKIILPQLEKLQIRSATSRSSFSRLRF